MNVNSFPFRRDNVKWTASGGPFCMLDKERAHLYWGEDALYWFIFE